MTDTNTAWGIGKGQEIFDWIMARLSENRRVYISTSLRRTYLDPKHAEFIKVSQDSCHCLLRRGNRWDIINGCRIEAV